MSLNLTRELKNKYNQLLGSIILILLISPVINKIHMGVLLISLLFLLAILPAFRVSVSKKIFRRWVIFLVSAFLIDVFIELKLISSAKIVIVIPDFIYLVFFGLSIFILTKKIITYKIITGDVIRGGIAIYLLSGLFWALIYSIIYRFDPGSFSGFDPESINFVYFSYTTLVTLGYGDISPITALPQILSNLEAIYGQLYLAILISRMVGINISQNIGEEHKK